MRSISIVIFLALLGCPGGGGTKPPETPSTPAPDAGTAVADASTTVRGHSDMQKGIGHKLGKEDPLKKCVICHGKDLTGRRGPSCYACHFNKNHDTRRGTVNHRSGSSQTCTACHGPNNTGGLGPACSTCHR